MRVFEIRGLGKMSGPERDRERTAMTKKFMVCTLHKILFFLMAQQPPVGRGLLSVEALQ